MTIQSKLQLQGVPQEVLFSPQLFLEDHIRKHKEGRTLALAKNFGWHKATVSRILIILKSQAVLVKNPDGSFGPAEEWQ